MWSKADVTTPTGLLSKLWLAEVRISDSDVHILTYDKCRCAILLHVAFMYVIGYIYMYASQM